MRFIFFTKTDWAEPPRLRHQLARLLADAGHKIVFFQRPYYPGQRIGKDNSEHAHISLYRYRQLLHHKLRLHPLLHQLNALFEKKWIRDLVQELQIGPDDVIINFNYDYFFLRDLFPKNRLITLINDNFWCRAICEYEKPLKWGLYQTCVTSNYVLTVSPPLLKDIEEICPAELFLPWADSDYVYPSKTVERNTLLFWGYIGDKIDYGYLSDLAFYIVKSGLDIKIELIGPIVNDLKNVNNLKSINAIKVLPQCEINSLKLDHVIAAFIPYKPNNQGNDACFIPNKLLRLMAKGLPVTVKGMPNFIQAPFVFRLGGGFPSDIDIILEIKDNFFDLQRPIQEFVDSNCSEDRLKQFLSYLN